MAKQTTKVNPVEAAEKILADLQSKCDRIAALREADDRELGAVSYQALAAGDRDAANKLEAIKDRATRRDIELKAIRSAIAALRQRFTLRQTLRTVPIMFSIALVQASERRSGVGSLRRATVSISSRPSRRLAATPGACCSSRRARLRSSRSALSASSSSQACRSARRTEACSGFGSRSVTLRAL